MHASCTTGFKLLVHKSVFCGGGKWSTPLRLSWSNSKYVLSRCRDCGAKTVSYQLFRTSCLTTQERPVTLLARCDEEMSCTGTASASSSRCCYYSLGSRQSIPRFSPLTQRYYIQQYGKDIECFGLFFFHDFVCPD